MFYRVICLVVSRLRWWLCIICLWILKNGAERDPGYLSSG
jgi:hypothetical protein